MKLRAGIVLKRVSEGDSPSATKKIRLDSFESLFPGMLISYGKFGKCYGSECDGVPMETAEYDGYRLCKQCAEKEHKEKGEKYFYSFDYKFEPSDAKFKCPAYSADESCKSLEVSFKDFYLGACCQPASKWLTENKKGQEIKLKTIRHYYDSVNKKSSSARSTADDRVKGLWKAEHRLRQEKKKFENEVEEMKRRIEEREKYVAHEKVNLENAKKEVRQIDAEKEPHVKRYKQMLYEYHSVANELFLDCEGKPTEIKVKKDKCSICKKEYADKYNRRKSALATCGHTGCHGCFYDARKIDDGEYYDDSDDEYYYREPLYECPIGECGEDFKRDDIIELQD